MPRLELCELWASNSAPEAANPPKREQPIEEASIMWFSEYMRLYCKGLTPSVSPTEYMPSRRALAEYFGPRAATIFCFDDHGMPEYEAYARQLFVRVLQLPWPVNGVLPLHFARGMLVEAMGVEVNWAEFAYKQTHPHQSRTRIPRVLPQFMDLKQPLEPLQVVMPRVNIREYSPLSKADSKYVRKPRHLPQTPSSPSDMSDTPARAPAGIPLSMLEDLIFVDVSRKTPTPNVERRECSSKGYRTIDEAAAIGLVLLRPGFNNILKAERLRLIESRHDIGKPVVELRNRLAEEMDKQKFLTRKVAEKADSQSRASEEYGRARDMYAAARIDEGKSTTEDYKVAVKNFTINCENLVSSWCENVEVAHTRLCSWEFKLKRQTERVSKLRAELTAAEAIFGEKRNILGNSLLNLQAAADVLADL